VGDDKQVVDAVAAAGGGDDIHAVADDVDIHIQGDVAWAEGRGRFTRAGGGERPVRMTCVLVREDGQWKVVQSHASIGVPDADIFG
jgi:ketosteroid isomerase-like protein